jgi:hypothetical protein
MVRNFVSAAVFFCLGASVYWCLNFCWTWMVMLSGLFVKNQGSARSHLGTSPI